VEIKTKANIGDNIFYIDDNRPCSAPVISIKVVLNESDAEKKASTEEQKKIWLAFGSACVEYKTIHGRYFESQIYLTREDLGEAIADGSFDRKTT